jgi:hypothetical protein
MQQPEVCSAIIDLTKKEPALITVLYLGTATYDLEAPKHNQTIRLSEAGCTITEVCLHGDCITSPEDMARYDICSRSLLYS